MIRRGLNLTCVTPVTWAHWAQVMRRTPHGGALEKSPPQARHRVQFKWIPLLEAFMHTFMLFECSCSGIDVMLPFLSPPIEAQWDSIDFYLERKALDPFVDGLEIMTPAVAWDDSVSSMLGLPWDLLKIVCWNNSNCHIHLLQECDGPCLLLLCSKIDFRGYVCMMCISWERLCFGCNSTWRIMQTSVSVKHSQYAPTFLSM